MTRKEWEELKVGFGLEEIPKQYRNQVQCRICTTPRHGKLYSDFVGWLASAGTYRKLVKALEMVNNSCYCKYHAEQMFGERNE
jgi:hypothetical protein